MGDHEGTSQTEVFNRVTDRFVSVDSIKSKILSDWNWKEWLFSDYDVDDIQMIVESMDKKLKVVQDIRSAVFKKKVGLEPF